MPVRAIVDTNVLVSGLISEHNPPRQIIDAWLDGRYRLVTSPYQVEEVNHVLSYPQIAGRIRLEGAELDLILAAMLSEAELVPGHVQMPGVTRDPKDDPIVASACEGRADYLVSGDQDLLAVGKIEGVRVVTPRQFVKILGLEN